MTRRYSLLIVICFFCRLLAFIKIERPLAGAGCLGVVHRGSRQLAWDYQVFCNKWSIICGYWPDLYNKSGCQKLITGFLSFITISSEKPLATEPWFFVDNTAKSAAITHRKKSGTGSRIEILDFYFFTAIITDYLYSDFSLWNWLHAMQVLG